MKSKSLEKHKGDKMLTAGAKSYQYDAAGRTTRVTAPNGITNIAYDWESRISTINGPGITASYTYNGLDTRVSKLENGQSQTFVRDGAYVTDPVLRDTSAAYTSGISVRRNGEHFQPIRVNDNGQNIDGHHRAVAHKLAFPYADIPTTRWEGNRPPIGWGDMTFW